MASERRPIRKELDAAFHEQIRNAGIQLGREIPASVRADRCAESKFGDYGRVNQERREKGGRKLVKAKGQGH